MRNKHRDPIYARPWFPLVVLLGLLAADAAATLAGTGDVRCLVVKCVVVK